MKLSGWTYIVMGLCIGLSALAFVFLQIYQPTEQQAEYNRTYRDQLTIEANKLPQAENRVRTAMAKVNETAHEWSNYVATKTPPATLAAGGINLGVNPYQLVVDSLKYRDKAQRAFNTQLKRGGVKIVSAPEIPFPGEDATKILVDYYGMSISPFPVVIWDLGSVTVSGNYQQIMRNVRAWSSMPHYLAVTDGLRIDGTSPNLTASYNVTIVGFMRGREVYAAPPDLGASAGGGSGAPSVNNAGGGRGGTSTVQKGRGDVGPVTRMTDG